MCQSKTGIFYKESLKKKNMVDVKNQHICLKLMKCHILKCLNE